MKKYLALAFSLVLCLSLLTACGDNATDDPSNDNGDQEKAVTVKVAASPAPHAEILEVAKEVLKEQNIDLEIIEFTDYIQPNSATESGDVDANYFQHLDYLNSFNVEQGTHLVNVADIHYEPFGLYPGKTATIDELTEGAKIAVPNDPSNEARALLLLEAEGLIKLKEGVGLKATKLDVIEDAEDSLNIEIVEMEAAQLPGALSSVDMAVINGNYAIAGGLDVNDTVATEDPSDEAKDLYKNILVVKEGNENNEAIVALINALQSDKVRDFINEKHNGAVMPMF